MIGTIRFSLRTDKKLKDGRCPIQMIYSIAGIRSVYNTKLTCLEAYWNKDEQMLQVVNKTALKGYFSNTILDKVQIDEFNNDLNLLKGNVLNIERAFHGKEISSSLVIEQLKLQSNPNIVKSEPRSLVYDFIDRYIQENQATRVKGSLKVYGTLKKHLQNFEIYRKKKVTFGEINYSFFQEFRAYLFQLERKVGDEKRQMLNSTIAKQIKTLKTFLKYARLQGIIVDRSYEDFTVKKDEKDIIALTQDEFDLLYNADLSENKRLERIRDIFCFSCTTGLRWSDLQNLEWHNIRGNEIIITVHKTREKLSIPLSQISAAILYKYKQLDLPTPLPRIAGQTFNKYIKELCQLLSFDTSIEMVRNRGAERVVTIKQKWELISAHTGRRTFVTLSLEKGIAAEYIMRITGHKDYKSFKRYIDLTEKSKAQVVVNAWGKPEHNFSLKIV
ncbi:hypothetical protein SMI01S_07700 [Sphingobacterium mizutaii NBRC 14946 = DSM 11724]|uniref:Site-specific tyrosine recombinase XerC n=2 Tax=Sphingobacterium mizutaii TaxID=1010 RepID=A0AAJ4XBZ2_9SPHI|nr:site-specific integrase [Sphingobacterium mizutaii]GEM67164.1 hypothetical protein SMI01S_07700 [Sphingobacterium mizutaii NBRC 14946 = DSM 11724]SDK98021.1 Site-specific recombinase XerD [Sphingobacterium mizutaii]SNV49325.1 site-specific tyrosine recombinase XerC [Sphingobacterium mizutaii]